MPWFKVDDGFANSKPVLRIPRRYRTAAVGLWTLAGTWSAKELTDGFIPDYALEDFCATPALAAHLVKAGLWEESSSGWVFVGWEKYQFTKSKVLEHRAAEAEKKRKWREAKAAAAEQDESEMSPRDTPGDSHGNPGGTHARSTSTRPDQTRPVPSSLVTSSGGVAEVDARDEPPLKCPAHKNWTDVPPCRRCASAREAHEAWASESFERKRKAKEAAAAIRDSCRICQGTNWIPDTHPAIKCNHQEAS